MLAACVVVVACGAGVGALGAGDAWRLTLVLASALILAALGLVDDIRPLPALPRLAVQLAAMAIGIGALPEGTRVLPLLPLGAERALLLVGGAWFINLTNFMDGMDWITVVDAVPLAAWLVGAWFLGVLPPAPGLLALGLVAGMLGYAPFNRPMARLFLGDVGSLPLGFLLAYLLFALAANGHLAAALMLPLYPIADSTITLLWRLKRRERIWQPHRHHFYQTAATRGLSVWQILGRVAALNAALCLMAGFALDANWRTQGALLVLASAIVAAVLYALSRGRTARTR